ncbi:MAG: hypothetical protein QM401_09030 [Bacillota bacterium]|nr:hypothetical protein [Bacillota bacterium]
MEGKHLGALILIILGISILAKNLHITAGLFWPLVLIVLGSIAFYQANCKKHSPKNTSNNVVWEVNEDSPLLSKILVIPIIIIGMILFIISLGLATPLLILSVVFLPVLLFIKLGWVFIRVLLTIIFAAAPILLILFGLSFIFF